MLTNGPRKALLNSYFAVLFLYGNRSRKNRASMFKRLVGRPHEGLEVVLEPFVLYLDWIHDFTGSDVVEKFTHTYTYTHTHVIQVKVSLKKI